MDSCNTVLTHLDVLFNTGRTNTQQLSAVNASRRKPCTERTEPDDSARTQKQSVHFARRENRHYHRHARMYCNSAHSIQHRTSERIVNSTTRRCQLSGPLWLMLPRRSIDHIRSHAWRLVAPLAVNGPECIQVYRVVDVYISRYWEQWGVKPSLTSSRARSRHNWHSKPINLNAFKCIGPSTYTSHNVN